MNNAHGRTCKKTKVYIYLYISLYENLFENGCIYIYKYIYIYIYIYIADSFIRIRDYKGVCNVRQCLFYFRDREIHQKTLVKAKQL